MGDLPPTPGQHLSCQSTQQCRWHRHLQITVPKKGTSHSSLPLPFEKDPRALADLWFSLHSEPTHKSYQFSLQTHQESDHGPPWLLPRSRPSASRGVTGPPAFARAPAHFTPGSAVLGGKSLHLPQSKVPVGTAHLPHSGPKARHQMLGRRSVNNLLNERCPLTPVSSGKWESATSRALLRVPGHLSKLTTPS